MATTQISIRLDKKLKSELDKLAEADGRTLSNLINYIIKQYVASQCNTKANVKVLRRAGERA